MNHLKYHMLAGELHDSYARSPNGLPLSMGVIGASYFGNIRWNIISRLLFFASFLGFIIPSKILDLWATLAVIIGILATPRVWRMIIGLVSPSSRPGPTLES